MGLLKSKCKNIKTIVKKGEKMKELKLRKVGKNVLVVVMGLMLVLSMFATAEKDKVYATLPEYLTATVEDYEVESMTKPRIFVNFNRDITDDFIYVNLQKNVNGDYINVGVKTAYYMNGAGSLIIPNFEYVARGTTLYRILITDEEGCGIYSNIFNVTGISAVPTADDIKKNVNNPTYKKYVKFTANSKVDIREKKTKTIKLTNYSEVTVKMITFSKQYKKYLRVKVLKNKIKLTAKKKGKVTLAVVLRNGNKKTFVIKIK